MKTFRYFQVFGLAAMVVLSTSLFSACPKPPPPPPPPEEPTGPVVRALDPSQAEEQDPQGGILVGSGFQAGAVVQIGSSDASDVVVEDAERISLRIPGMSAGRYDVSVTNPDGGKGILRGGFTVLAPVIEEPDCELQPIQFAFNEAVLEAEARTVIKDNVRCIDDKGIRAIRLEGHADERGSTEYNLALGQRRADSVQTFLVNLGFDPNRVTTIS